MESTKPVILNESHFGGATTAEMSLPKQQRMIESLSDPDNWLSSGKPDSILSSGGGDDLVGNQFCIFLDYSPTPVSSGLDAASFQAILDMIEATYRDLFYFRNRYAPGVPIFGHDYDFPIPNSVHPVCAGPWLKLSLDFCGWDAAAGTAIIQSALAEFKALLTRLTGESSNNFTLVEIQGTINPATYWAHELHPFASGFIAIAEKFVVALRAKFPGRI